MWNKRKRKNQAAFSTGVSVTVDELLAVRYQLLRTPIKLKQASLQLISGQNFSKARGRGIEFDSTREYQLGDDIRRMAWRVTARSLKPHVKVYLEEKERPIWLALDLSPSLFFGTRVMFKSVCAIKQIAYLGWSYLQKRERIGAIITSPQKCEVFEPQARERDFLGVLKQLSQYSYHQPAFTEKNCLYTLLTKTQQQVRAGNLLFIVSDFFNFDAVNQKLILQLAERTQVSLTFVYDPFEAIAPPAYTYVVTDGIQKTLFNLNNSTNRQEYQQQFNTKLNALITFSRKYNIHLQLLSTDKGVVTQA